MIVAYSRGAFFGSEQLPINDRPWPEHSTNDKELNSHEKKRSCL